MNNFFVACINLDLAIATSNIIHANILVNITTIVVNSKISC